LIFNPNIPNCYLSTSY